MAVGIASELFERSISIHTQRTRPNYCIGGSVRSDSELLTVCTGNGERVLWANEKGLQRVMHFAKVNRMAPHVPDFQNPIMPERALDSEIPLLDTRDSEVARHLEGEKVDAVVDEHGSLRSVGSWGARPIDNQTRDLGQRRTKSRDNHPRR